MQGGTYAAVRHLDYLQCNPDSGNYLVWILGHEYIHTKMEFDTMAEHYIRLGLLEPDAVHIRDEGKQGCSFNIKFYDSARQKSGPSLTVETVSVGEPHKIQRVAPNGVLACEVGIWAEEAFLRAIGRLAQKDGWLWASGSFEGASGWLTDLWNKWRGDNEDNARSYSVPSHTNLNVFPGGENDPKILARKRLYPEFLFKQRFLGIPASPEGLVFADFDTTKHVSSAAVYDPKLPVYLFVDPGYNTAYAVLAVQVSDAAIYVVDEVYEQKQTSEGIIDIVKHHSWYQGSESGKPSNVPYVVLDIASTQHHVERSAEEVWRAAGFKTRYKKIKVEDSIDRIRSVLRSDGSWGIPKLYINPKCRGLISEMGGAPSPFKGREPWSYKTTREGGIVGDIPDDKNNDACKALAYGLVEMFGFVEDQFESERSATWTQNQGPRWTEWGSDVAPTKSKYREMLSGGAKYLCAAKVSHDSYPDAVGCKGH